jgi:hypothetical protein
MYPGNYAIQSVAALNVAEEQRDDEDDQDHHHDTQKDAHGSTTGEKHEKIKLPKKEKPILAGMESKETTIAADDKADIQRYVLLTLLSPASQALRTDTMVEVIDVGSMPISWRSSTSEESLGHIRAISLDRRWILPHPGMEILSSATIITSDDPHLSRRTHFIPSQATGAICK